MTPWRWLIPMRLCGLSSACAIRLPPVEFTQEHCLDRLRLFDGMVLEQRAGDAQAARIEGFPFLRSSRFLASFANEDMDPGEFAEWIGALSDLDRLGREHETANLAATPPLVDSGCRRRLVAEALASPELGKTVRRRAQVADAYSELRRGLGLYPLSKWPVWSGVNRLHEATRECFARPAAAAANSLHYAPRGSSDVDIRSLFAHRDALGRPRIDPRDLAKLFDYFAPVIAVDTERPADQLGAPYWKPSGRVGVDTAKPRVYRLLGHTSFNGRVLPQLNYVFWFPARPKSHLLDLLGGHLDGLTWRLTLDENGRALLANSMHNCGCYHMFFPSNVLRGRVIDDGTEPPLIPASLPTLRPGERYVMYLSSGTHYIRGIATVPADGTGNLDYELEDYDALRSMPQPSGGRRSLFGPDGLVVGSERLERFLLWPMGVPSAGAMRQWGHHATAFVGKRHFDDAKLLDRYFELPTP